MINMDSISDFFGNIQCYSLCLTNSEFFDIIVLSFLFFIALGVFYFITKRYISLFSSQTSGTSFILMNIISMECSALQLFWIYTGIILIGAILLISARFIIQRELNNTFESFGFLKEFEKKFNVKIFVLDKQKFKAFTLNKKIYLSLGLIETLTKEEVLAVVSHEVYHVRNSPNRILASFLALSSLSFKGYSDEINADKFAVYIAGLESWKNALIKLNVKNAEKRLKNITML